MKKVGNGCKAEWVVPETPSCCFCCVPLLPPPEHLSGDSVTAAEVYQNISFCSEPHRDDSSIDMYAC